MVEKDTILSLVTALSAQLGKWIEMRQVAAFIPWTAASGRKEAQVLVLALLCMVTFAHLS